jgi:hypothetical protein
MEARARAAASAKRWPSWFSPFSAMKTWPGATVRLSVETPSERRSATLNLVYTPLYIAGIVGPAAGAAVAGVTLSAVFVAGAVITAIATIAVFAWTTRTLAASSSRR